MTDRTRRGMSRASTARLGGLAVVVKHGPAYMAELARARHSSLDRQIAAEAGIPGDLTPEDFAARLAAARRAYFIRLAHKRWDRR